MRNSNPCFPYYICSNVHGRNFRKQMLPIILMLRDDCYWHFGVNASRIISVISIFGDYNNTVIKGYNMEHIEIY